MADAKYYQGRYAVCPGCSQRPCIGGDCPGHSNEPPQTVVAIRKPASGRAIPFQVWDTVIPQYKLSVMESSTLLYLCRKTIGHGRYMGNYISIAQIAAGLNIGTGTVKRALNVLESHKLIERSRQGPPQSGAWTETHIRVTLPEG